MVLLVIDTQKGITNERLYAYDDFVSNVTTLINEARSAGVEVVFIRCHVEPSSLECTC